MKKKNDADQGIGLQIKWEGDVDDPIIKLRDIKQKVPVETIHLYKSKLKIMIQGSTISKWIEEEFPCLSELMNDTSTYDQIKWQNDWFYIESTDVDSKEENPDIKASQSPKISYSRRKEIIEKAKLCVKRLNQKREDEI